MLMNIFVNESITNGIKNYLAKKNGTLYDISHVFEYEIINLLIKLYGEINIINPYIVNNETSFKSNLMLYGAKEEEITKLIDLLNTYNKWLSSTSREKNSIIEEIFTILIKLVTYKALETNMDNGEMAYFKSFFALKDNKIRQIVEMSSNNKSIFKDLFAKVYKETKEEKEKPEPYLSEERYEKYGLSMEEVLKVPEHEIERLNNLIEVKEEEEKVPKPSPLRLILSSGNGFIDALVLFSIMCTEIMIGIIVTVLIARLGWKHTK